VDHACKFIRDLSAVKSLLGGLGTIFKCRLPFWLSTVVYRGKLPVF
jgi:hypothetical protein